MKHIGYCMTLLFGTLLLTQCASMRSAQTQTFAGDDLYETLDTEELKRQEEAAAARRRAPLDKYVASILSEAEGKTPAETGNPYRSILADDYQTAYERRIYGMQSPTYQMPSSYATATTRQSFIYATAYDPAQYNIIVSGDQVWVEPKYITSMFGTWGGTPFGYTYFSYRYAPYYSPYWGWRTYPCWGDPYWGTPWWGFTESWYYAGMGFHHPWWGYGWGGYGWGWGYYRPHNHRYDSYTGHGVTSGYRHNPYYNRRHPSRYDNYRDRNGNYNRRDSYNRQDGYRNDRYNTNDRYNNRYNNRNDYSRPNRNESQLRPSYNNNTPIRNTGGYRNTGGGGNRYNRGR